MRIVFFSLVTAALALCARDVAATDVGFYGVLKSVISVQTNSAAPVPASTNGYLFSAFVYATGTNLVTSATLQPPNPTPQQTLPELTNGTTFLFQQFFNTSNDMESVYPSGGFFSLRNFGVTMNTVNDGTHTGTLIFGQIITPGTYPNAAQITNFSAAQSIDATAPFKIGWTLANGSNQFYLQMTVNDTNGNVYFTSPAPGGSNALTGLSNSVVVPANALPPGTNLIAHLSVESPVGGDTNSYPGAIGLAGYGTETQFPLITRPATVLPQLSILSGKTFPFRFQFTGATNQNYHIQASTNLTNWADLLVTNTAATNGNYTDTNSTNSGRKFYRIKVGP
jgi:hypothetical protein